jgi:nucleoside-diphosphate-sugar epimerase
VGDGNTQKSIVGRRNLVAAIHFALERDQPGCEVFNVSDSETLTVRELADMIAEIGNWPRPRGVPAMVANVMAPCGDIFERLTGRAFPLTTARLRALVEETVFPCDKLVAAGFRHPADVRTGLEEMISWAMSSGGLAPQPSGDARTHP